MIIHELVSQNVGIDRLVKMKLQDNLEFFQWFVQTYASNEKKDDKFGQSKEFIHFRGAVHILRQLQKGGWSDDHILKPGNFSTNILELGTKIPS